MGKGNLVAGCLAEFFTRNKAVAVCIELTKTLGNSRHHFSFFFVQLAVFVDVSTRKSRIQVLG